MTNKGKKAKELRKIFYLIKSLNICQKYIVFLKYDISDRVILKSQVALENKERKKKQYIARLYH